MRVVRNHFLGGIIDTRHRKLLLPCGTQGYQKAGGKPHVWYASHEQAELVLHGRDLDQKLLVYGAMGAGKTRVLAMWLIARSLESVAAGWCRDKIRDAGATAPTQERRDILVKALAEVCRNESWYRYRVARCNFALACGITIELRATKEQTAAVGSAIQGQNWLFHGGDEYQDQIHAHHHIAARGRTAPDGVYRQCVTATAKDSLAWREWRDGLSDLWGVKRLDGPSNVFVHRSWWTTLRKELSSREFKRVVLAMDVGPERQVHVTWDREHNLCEVPAVGAKDVTAQVLRRSGADFAMLIGHDPGVLRNVSVLLKAFEIKRGRKPAWFIMGEFETKQTTTEEHAMELRTHLQTVWGIQYQGVGEHRALVRTDPWTQRDTGTHKSVYEQFRQAGFDIKSAAYNKKGEGRGMVPLRASVEMVNRLFCSADKTRRLFVAQNEDGKSAAPETMRAIELSEWDPWGMKQMARKGDKTKDPTDHTSAVRYALWAYEQTRPNRGLHSTELAI